MDIATIIMTMIVIMMIVDGDVHFVRSNFHDLVYLAL